MDWQDAKIGHLYFRFGYADPAFLNPMVHPVIYLGIDVAGDAPNGPCHYYQDTESYLARGPFPNMARCTDEDDESFIVEVPIDEPCSLKSAEEVALELSACESIWRVRTAKI